MEADVALLEKPFSIKALPYQGSRCPRCQPRDNSWRPIVDHNVFMGVQPESPFDRQMSNSGTLVQGQDARLLAEAEIRRERAIPLGDHFISGQRLSVQNRPTETAVVNFLRPLRVSQAFLPLLMKRFLRPALFLHRRKQFLQ